MNVQRDLVEDLAAEQAEGESELFESEDAFEAEEPFEGEDTWESEDAYESEDAWESEDAYESEDAWESEDAYESETQDAFLGAAANALSAESEDEFFGKLVRGISRVAKRVAPVIGRVARAAAPILSAIPHPAAQVAAKVARVASNLRAEAGLAGESEVAIVQRAAEAAAEMATRDPRAKPVVVGLVSRQLLQRRATAMTPAQRMQAVRRVNAAARSLTNAAGPAALRALPRIAQSVNRTAQAKATPPAAKPRILQRAAQRLAARPESAARLAQPNQRARRLVRSVGGIGGRTWRTRGPVEITIRAL
jgi:hypothetical protein